MSFTVAGFWRRRTLRIAATVLAAAIALVLVALAAKWPFTNARVLQSLHDGWPGPAKFAGIRSIYLPYPGCVMENVVLELPSPRAQQPARVTIAKARIEARYWDLLLRPGRIARVSLEGLRVEIPTYGSKSNGSEESPRHAASHLSMVFGTVDATQASVIVHRSDGKSPLNFDIYQLKLESVRGDAPIRYEADLHNPLPPGAIHVQGRFGPWESRPINEIPLSGSYSFADADLGVFDGIAGLLSSNGEFSGALGRIDTKGAVQVPAFELKRARHAVALASTFHAMVNATRGDVTLHEVDSSFLGTSVRGSGTIASAPGQQGKTASLDLTVQRGRIQDVLRLFVTAQTPPMNGAAQFKTHVVIPPGQTPFLKKVTLTGQFSIAGAVLTNAARQGDVNTLSKRARGQKDLQETPPVSAQIEGDLKLRNRSAQFSFLKFEVPGASIRMTGKYNLETKAIDFHGDARTQAKLSQQTTGIKSVVLKPFDWVFKNKNAGADVRVGMTGTYERPHFGIEPPVKK